MTLRDRIGGIPWITSLESLGITRPDQIVIRIRPLSVLIFGINHGFTLSRYADGIVLIKAFLFRFCTQWIATGKNAVSTNGGSNLHLISGSVSTLLVISRASGKHCYNCKCSHISCNLHILSILNVKQFFNQSLFR